MVKVIAHKEGDTTVIDSVEESDGIEQSKYPVNHESMKCIGCVICGKTRGGSFSMTGGKIYCESCNVKINQKN